MTLSATPETLDELDRPATVAGSDPDLVARLRTTLAGREVVTGPYVHFASRHLDDTRLRLHSMHAPIAGKHALHSIHVFKGSLIDSRPRSYPHLNLPGERRRKKPVGR